MNFKVLLFIIFCCQKLFYNIASRKKDQEKIGIIEINKQSDDDDDDVNDEDNIHRRERR